MTADGKIVAAQLRAGQHRILVLRTTREGVVIPAIRKSEAIAATVTGVTKFHKSGSGHFRTVNARTHYRISTTAGVIDSAPAQTYWLASPRATRRRTP